MNAGLEVTARVPCSVDSLESVSAATYEAGT